MTQINKVITMHVPANLIAERQAAAARLAECRRHKSIPEGLRFFRGVFFGLLFTAGLAFVVWFSIWGWRLL